MIAKLDSTQKEGLLQMLFKLRTYRGQKAFLDISNIIEILLSTIETKMLILSFYKN